MGTPVVRIEDVAKSFGSVRALDGVGFEVPARSVFGLLGPNGAGKTTLFSIVANFLKADRGRVEVLGVDVRRVSDLQGRMTILPQDAEFERNVPILEQLTFFRQLDGRDRQTAEEEVRRGLELVGLAEHAHRGVRALSHGMVKRLGLAQAFLGEPEVILLDEPTSGLDPANARQIRDLVRRLQERTTVVVSSHNLAEIQELCDRVAILDHGKLVACGSVDELTRTDRELELEFARPLAEEELAALRALPMVADVRPRQERGYTAFLDLGGEDGASWDAAVASLLRALLERELVPRRLNEGRSLETHFLRVTGGAEAAQEG